MSKPIREPDTVLWLNEELDALRVAMLLAVEACDRGELLGDLLLRSLETLKAVDTWDGVLANLMQTSERLWQRLQRVEGGEEP